jgi:hypothetical protein
VFASSKGQRVCETNTAVGSIDTARPRFGFETTADTPQIKIPIPAPGLKILFLLNPMAWVQ